MFQIRQHTEHYYTHMHNFSSFFFSFYRRQVHPITCHKVLQHRIYNKNGEHVEKNYQRNKQEKKRKKERMIFKNPTQKITNVLRLNI